MNVLSLFDGVSCARVALDRAKLIVNTNEKLFKEVEDGIKQNI